MSPAVTSCLATCIPSSGARHNPEDNASHLLPCQTSLVAPTAPQPMPFKNEVVSDEDIDRYNLPFPKGEGRWWTRDAERDYYLWGGLVGNLAFDDRQEGRFHLYADGIDHKITVLPGERLKDTKTGETVFIWKEVIEMNPKMPNSDLHPILREALEIYGFDGRRNLIFPNSRVVCLF